MLSIDSDRDKRCHYEINDRQIKKGVDERLCQEQAGFRQGRGTMEQICTLRNILEHCMEWQAPIYVNFVDFRKAFDSVIREEL